MASASARRPNPISSEAFPSRLMLNVEKNVSMPRPASPSTADPGTRTLSSVTSAVGIRRSPIGSVWVVDTPGRSVSTRNAVIPSGAMAYTRVTWLSHPRFTWVLAPSMIQSSPSRSAVVRISFMDEPTPGSEIDSEKISVPRAIPGR